jgi:hypothetical protein
MVMVAAFAALVGLLLGSLAAGSAGADDDTVGAQVPSGAVVAFDRTNCPSGWSAYSKANGRVVVGTLPGGTVAAVVGTRLGDKEVRLHRHHVNIPAFPTGNGGAHHHLALSFLNGEWKAGNGASLHHSTTGMDYSGSGFYPVGVDETVAVVYTAYDGTHAHLIDPPLRLSTTAWNQVPYVQLTYCKKN